MENVSSEITDVGPCKKLIVGEVPAEEVAKELDKSFGELTENVMLPGFRKGHAPRKLVEKHFHSTVLEDVKRQMLARSWEQVKKEREVRPVSEPDLAEDRIEFDEEKGLSYSLAIEVVPKFDVTDYKGLELTRPPAEVDEKEVEQILERLRRRNAVLEPVEFVVNDQPDG